MALATAIFFVFLVVVFLFSVGFQFLGHHVGKQWQAHGHGGYGESTSAIQSSLFALLGLLIAFTISGGEDRLDARRHLIVEEANSIETAYLRLDLLPAPAQPALREMFRRYTEARIAYFRQITHLDEAQSLHDRATELQREIWTAATAAARETSDVSASLLTLPAINAMIDVTTERDAALRTHVPLSMFILMLLLAFACALLAGMEMSKQPRPSPFHLLAFAGTLALTCYVIVNIELPRIGWAPLGPIDALFAQVRQRMG